MSTKTHRRPATVATLTLLGGIAASLSGNLQAINLDNHQPGIGAYISAVVWPMTLLAVVEVLIHTPWLRTWRDGLTKAAAVGLVGAMAAYISYFHLAHTLSAYGYDVASRYAGPLAIDAAMVMATLALNRVGHARRALASVQAEPVQVAQQDTPPPVQYVATQADVDESEAAFRGEGIPDMDSGVADEAQHYLKRLSTVLDVTTTPAVPVQAGRVVTRINPASVPADAAKQIMAWLVAPYTVRPRAGQVDEAIAAQFEVSPRTARGWRDALASVWVRAGDA
jgi:hypothetical protein